MAQWIKANNETSTVTPTSGSTFKLEEMQEFVGGYIQLVHASNGDVIVLDEEGKIKEKPINRIATELYEHGHLDPIVGDVLVCASDEVD